MNKGKVVLLAGIAVLVALFFVLDLGQYVNLASLKDRQADIAQVYQSAPLATMLTYFVFYIVFTGLSLPGASILTLAGGAIFGLLVGTLLVSFASTIGATLAFLASRYLFRDYVQDRFADRLQVINEGIHRDGAFYLFTLRLVPVFPYFVINLLMGLTRMPVLTYALVSQLGMLAATIVYVNAGTQLAGIEQAGDILSPALIASFVVLGLFPLITKKLVDWLRPSGQQASKETSIGQ